MEMFDNPHLNWGVLNPEMIMQKGINIEEAESTEHKRKMIAEEINKRYMNKTGKTWLDSTNAKAISTRNGNNAGRMDNYDVISPGFITDLDKKIERGSRNFKRPIIEQMEDGTDIYDYCAEKRCFFKKDSKDVISFDDFMTLGNRSSIQLHVYRNLAVKSTEKNIYDNDNAGTPGLSRAIQFQFIDCQNAKSQMYNHAHSIKGSRIHEYFLPDSKPGSKFGFKDREWLSLFPDLLNVYIAEIIYSRKDYEYEKNVPIYVIEEYVKGEWIPHKSTSNIELMNKIRDNIIYVGTTMVREGERYRWVHFPKGWNYEATPQQKILSRYNGYSFEYRGLQSHIPLHRDATLDEAKHVYMDNEDLTEMIRLGNDYTSSDASTNYLPRCSSYDYYKHKKKKKKKCQKKYLVKT